MIPHFDPDELDIAQEQSRARAVHVQHRDSRWRDRFWLNRLLMHLNFWIDDYTYRWDSNERSWWSHKDIQLAPGRKLPQELKYWRWCKRATDRWPRSFRKEMKWEKRHARRKSRQNERVALRQEWK